MALPVSDSLSNLNEQIEACAKLLSRSEQARTVFNQIYHGKKKIKSVAELAESTGLSRKQVLTQGKKLADHYVVNQTKKRGDTAYEKIDVYHRAKSRILSLSRDYRKLKEFPTKRKTGSKIDIVMVPIVAQHARAKRITIDQIESFSEVRSIESGNFLSDELSEKEFKNGLKAILAEEGEFTDWGGEKDDLYTTRLKLNGKRRAAAFALKGPGTKGKLTPKKMGKNGDQIQRLFQAEADVFLVQYCRQIDESIIELLFGLATAKSALEKRDIWYGVIDGVDSRRLYLAYYEEFDAPSG